MRISASRVPCPWSLAPYFIFAILCATTLAQESAPPPAPAAATTPAADGALLPGHSAHGEVFNEGPRQGAYLLEGMGHINFPVATQNEEVQKFINQGVAQLHGFWYFESERSFRQAAMLDPECAMAFWGMAMSNINNEARAKGFMAEAVKRRDKASPRDQKYIDALNAYLAAPQDKRRERAEAYVSALEKILYEFPDDTEAKAFLALQIWENRNVGINVQSNLAVDALLKQVFAVDPMHPAHHYEIHLWDLERPEFALASAANCGPALPGIAHMWHMPGHIYSRLRRYSDAAWQQEASARVDHAHMMRYQVLPDQIHNFAHNNEWLIRDLIYVGRVGDALSLARNMIELPQHPRYNVLSRGGCSSSYGRERLFDVLETYEFWDQLIQLANTPYLESTDIEREQVKRLRALGAAYFHLGNAEEGRRQLGELKPRLDAQIAARDNAVTEATDKAKAENKNEQDLAKAGEEAKKNFGDKVRELEQAIAELEGLDAASRGEFQPAVDSLRKAGRIDPLLLARYRHSAGQTNDAIKEATDYVGQHRNEVQPLAGLIDLLWQAGQKDAAKERFEQLRDISPEIDLAAGSPVFSRLVPIAQELGYPADWRLPALPATDVGQRPSLDSLGPFRWQPSPAPDWTLADTQGNVLALKQFHGKPVVLLFYLGYGCLHCAEQLQSFAPLAQQFSDAGISVVAISSDDGTGLKLSLENYKQGAFPFPLTSDAELKVFRAYRAFDDFENKPLHATFLIDGEGLIRWQDISYDPFMDGKFILQEAARQQAMDLLSSPSSLKQATAQKDALPEAGSPLSALRPPPSP